MRFFTSCPVDRRARACSPGPLLKPCGHWRGWPHPKGFPSQRRPVSPSARVADLTRKKMRKRSRDSFAPYEGTTYAVPECGRRAAVRSCDNFEDTTHVDDYDLREKSLLFFFHQSPSNGTVRHETAFLCSRIVSEIVRAIRLSSGEALDSHFILFVSRRPSVPDAITLQVNDIRMPVAIHSDRREESRGQIG